MDVDSFIVRASIWDDTWYEVFNIRVNVFFYRWCERLNGDLDCVLKAQVVCQALLCLSELLDVVEDDVLRYIRGSVIDRPSKFSQFIDWSRWVAEQVIVSKVKSEVLVQLVPWSFKYPNLLFEFGTFLITNIAVVCLDGNCRTRRLPSDFTSEWLH